MTKKRTAFFSCLLAIVMVLTDIPMTVTAADIAELFVSNEATGKVTATSKTADSQTTDEVETEAEVIAELPEKRDDVTKHFAMSDGTIKACIYPQNVHYLEDGVYEEIDNTLTETTKNGKKYYKNKKNSFSVNIPENFTDDFIEFSDENGFVKFKLDGASNKKIEKLTKKNDKKADVTDAKNVNDKATFKKVKGDVDVTYDLAGNKLKETIVLHKKTRQVFLFKVQTSAANVVVNNDNSVSFFHADGTELYYMESPYMVDAEGEYSNSIETVLEQTEDGYRLIYVPDYEWLSEKGRAYPVKIDPTMRQAIYKETVTDTYVVNKTSTIYGAWDVINVGRRADGTNQMVLQGLIRFDIPSEIGKNDCIVDAKLELVHYTTYPSDNGIEIDVHELTSGFTEGGTTWSNKPSYNPVITDYAIVNTNNKYPSNTAFSYDSYNLTTLVNKWHNGATNYGILLKYHDDANTVSQSRQVYYYAKQSLYYGSVSKFVEIVYRNTTGLEDYWSYSTQNFGKRGSGYVNNYNGNLVYVQEITSFNSGINGFTLSYVYNSSDVMKYATGEYDKWNYYGHGWSLNFVQTIEPVTITGNSFVKYKYTDGDGTGHYFVQNTDNKIVDEDGLGYTYEAISEGILSHKITDKNKTALKFCGDGYLRKIVDANGNSINLDYGYISGLGYHLTEITTSSGGRYQLCYEHDMLCYMIDNYGRYTGFYYDDNNNLSDISYWDNTSVDFFYEAANNETSASRYWLTKVKIPDNRTLHYEYYPKTGRIQRVKVVGSTGTVSGTNTFTYSQNQTRIVDQDNKGITYQFDTVGRPTCVYDDFQNIYSQSYQNNITRGTGIFKNNKVTSSSNGNTYVNNLITNPIMGGLSDWIRYQESSTSQITISNTKGLISSKPIKITSDTVSINVIAQQNPQISSERTYTISGYLKTENVQAAYRGAGLEIVTQGPNGNRQFLSDMIVGTTDTEINNGYQKVVMTVTLQQGESINRITAGLYNATGTVYIDSVQLEEGAIANPINLVSNSSFERYGTLPTGYVMPFGNSGEITGTTEQKKSGNASCKIYGFGTEYRRITQTINLSGQAGDIYTVGGWAKANAVSDHNPKEQDYGFTMYVRIDCTDNTSEWAKARFNEFVSDWQYVTKTFRITKPYTSLTVYCVYDFNKNVAYFDNLFLYKDTMNSYTYDNNGNVVSTADYAKQNQSFQYDGNDNLSKLITPTGSNYEYTYDTNNNLTSATSDVGLKYTMTYDSYGNALTSVTESTEEGFTDKITSTATYSADGNHLASVTDSRGNTTSYGYDEQGRVNEVIDGNGNGTWYSYDYYGSIGLNRVGGGGSEAYIQYDTNGALEYINMGTGMVYNFKYDSFARPTQILVGFNLLSESIYRDDSSTQLSRFNYGNGDYLTYTYDEQDRLVSEQVNGNNKRAYVYDKSGNVTEIQDALANVTTKYDYDLIGRPIRESSSDGQSTGYAYDNYNRIKYREWSFGSVLLKDSYIYGDSEVEGQKDGLIYGVKLNGTQKIGYEYDGLARLQTRTVNTQTPFVTTYTYLEGAEEGQTTTLVKKVQNGSDILEYTYDAVGNITSVSENGQVIATYTYNSGNQLATASYHGATYTYVYNGNGNLTSVSDGTNTSTYTYGNSQWEDLLTSYNGDEITYDAIGNPLDYIDGYSFDWENGRLLSSIKSYGNSFATFTYNADGLRTTKTIRDKTTEYYWAGGVLRGQKTDNEELYFLYDEDNAVYGFIRKNGTSEETYYYTFNLQGDIIGILDSSGTTIVEYTYGAWGDILSITGTHASTIGQLNPLRYRGYYYDAETGFYYLESRYYDPEIKRFINADSVISGTGDSSKGYNLFAYCFNNPINMSDESGHWPKWMKKAIKFVAKTIIRPAVKRLQKTLSKVDFTYSKGINVSATPGIFSFNLQGGISIDSKGNVALQGSASGGVITAGTPSASITTYHSVTNASNIGKLNGMGYQIGGTVSDVVALGGDFNIIPDTEHSKTYYGGTINLGFGTPGGETHIEWGNTTMLGVSEFNIFDVAEDVYIKIMEW